MQMTKQNASTKQSKDKQKQNNETDNKNTKRKNKNSMQKTIITKPTKLHTKKQYIYI